MHPGPAGPYSAVSGHNEGQDRPVLVQVGLSAERFLVRDPKLSSLPVGILQYNAYLEFIHIHNFFRSSSL